MTDKIKVYCDVDGVLNLNPRVHSYTHKERIVRQLPLINRSVSLNLRFKKDILDELNELPLSIYWLSTWNNDALRIFKKLGLELEQHVVPYKIHLQELLFGKQAGKYATLRRETEKTPKSPFIWADDVATTLYRKNHWSTEHLILPIKKSEGLTEDHLKKMRLFLSSLD